MPSIQSHASHQTGGDCRKISGALWCGAGDGYRAAATSHPQPRPNARGGSVGHMAVGLPWLTRPGQRLQFANWKMAIEIVDFPIKNGDFP